MCTCFNAHFISLRSYFYSFKCRVVYSLVSCYSICPSQTYLMLKSDVGQKYNSSGMTLRDGMGREVGGRIRIGNTCTPMTDSCERMAKTTTILSSNYPPIKRGKKRNTIPAGICLQFWEYRNPTQSSLIGDVRKDCFV